MSNLTQRNISVNPVLHEVRTNENSLKTQPSLFKDKLFDERIYEMRPTKEEASFPYMGVGSSFVTGSFMAQHCKTCLSTQEKESKYQGGEMM